MADDDLVLRHLREIRTKLDVELGEIRTKLDVELGEIRTKLEEHDKRFDAAELRFASFRGEVLQRFDLVEDRLENLEHHAVVTNSKLDATHARLVNVEVTRDETWAQVAATADSVNRLERNLVAQIVDLRVRVERLEASAPRLGR